MSSRKYLERNIEEMFILLTNVLTGKWNFKEYNDSYQKLRRRLNAFSSILGEPPDFIKSSPDLWVLWNHYIKETLPDYDSRRKFLRDNYEKHYEELMGKLGSKTFEEELMLRDIAIGRKIGEGGFGVVYEAEHIVLEEPRAVKKLEPIFAGEEDEIKALRRFMREVQILTQLNNPYIIKVYDAGIVNEFPYIIMELFNGKNLEHYIREKGCLKENLGVEVTKQVLSAISFAHDHGIVHRDINPKNIMWNGERAVVLDYGAGQWLEHRLSTRLTTAPIGTYGYIAEELFKDPKLLNKDLDCYSMGVSLHFFLTGHIPNVGNPTYYLEEMKISEDLTNFILKAMSPSNKRFSDGKEMLQKLNAISMK